ncbi:MAG: ATP-binding protein, partial [Clostridiales bacterium]|nr:ATP-binding protein [Clostridiales bacterium]
MENYTLALYRPILATPGAGGLFRCLTGRGNAADAYGVYMQALADFELDAGKYFTHLLGTSDNAFARAAHRGERLSRELAALVDYEMTVLSRLAMTAAPEGYPGWKPLKKPFTRAQWTKAYYDEGYGALYGGVAFTWAEAQGTFAAVKHRNPVTLDDLIDYDDNKRAAATNTEALLKGQPAQHVLLYGDRGTGKSSTVHALLNAYADRGLRLIGLSRRDLPSLPRIVEALRPSRFKFILLLDDLAFAEADDSFCELKAMLEGRGHIAGNVRVYAT